MMKDSGGGYLYGYSKDWVQIEASCEAIGQCPVMAGHADNYREAAGKKDPSGLRRSFLH